MAICWYVLVVHELHQKVRDIKWNIFHDYSRSRWSLDLRQRRSLFHHPSKRMRNEYSSRVKDATRANVLLAGIIGIFLFLTLVAFLFTDGKHFFVIPLLRKCFPSSRWVVRHDKVKITDERLISLQVGLAQHVLGVKRAYHQVWQFPLVFLSRYLIRC